MWFCISLTQTLRLFLTAGRLRVWGGMDVVVSIEVSAEMVMKVVKGSLDLNSESVYGSRPGTTIELDWKIMIRAPHYYVRAYK